MYVPIDPLEALSLAVYHAVVFSASGAFFMFGIVLFLEESLGKALFLFGMSFLVFGLGVFSLFAVVAGMAEKVG